MARLPRAFGAACLGPEGREGAEHRQEVTEGTEATVFTRATEQRGRTEGAGGAGLSAGPWIERHVNHKPLSGPSGLVITRVARSVPREARHPRLHPPTPTP